MIAQLSDITFGYPGTDLFENLSWQINAGDRIGLVGPNGSGKSTLLRLLSGELLPDTGQVVRTRQARVGYLRQSQEFGEGRSLLDELLAPFEDVLRTHEEMVTAERALERDHSEAALAAYAHLQERYTALGGYTLEARVRMLAADVGFAEADLSRQVSTFSGGERGRLELAKVLVAEPELLLLDEPTNHLDITAVERLEDFLLQYPAAKAFVIVSHDRAFLQRVCTSIVDVALGELDVYEMRYDKYVVEREGRRDRAIAEWRRQKEEIARQEDFIRKNIAGQKTNQAKSRRKMLEKLDRLERPEDAWGFASRIGLRFASGDHAGAKEAIKADRLTIGFEGAPLVRDLNLVIYRGDRIGIVGPNGAGKTTLLRTLLGQIEPLAGEITRGPGVRIGYYDQKHRDLDEEHSLVEEIQGIRPDWTPDPVRNYLARLRFFGDDVFRKVKGLSGGERSRLALGKMMLVPRNLLALDEPTNHLDIPAREVLEEALSGYDGTLIVVSHDRYFLDRTITKILELDGKGHGELHIGNWSDWRERKRTAAKKPAAAPPPTEEKQQRIADREADRDAKRKREQAEKRFQKLEQEIAELESEHARIKTALATDHGGDWQKLHTLVEEERVVSERLKSKMGEWEKLGRTLGL